MTGWAETDWRARGAALPPAVQTALVALVVGAVLALIPNGLIENVVFVSGLPALLPPLGPPIGMAGRVVLSVGGGLLAALAFATTQWLRERRALAGPVRRPLVDDRLTVEPLAARELGARFDDSPYLKRMPDAQAELVSEPEPFVEAQPDAVAVPTPPPTPDSRIDPDSTMGDPRWRVPGMDDGTVGGPEESAAELVQLIARDGGWDREAPTPDAEWQAEPPVAETAPGPGNAAEQWDAGMPEEAVDESSAEEPAAASLIRLSPAEPVAVPPGPGAPEPKTVPEPVPEPEPEDDLPLPTTEQLLERLARAAADRSLATRRPPIPPRGGAAEELAHALAALRGAA